MVEPTRIEADVLGEVTPSPSEERALAATVAQLEAAAATALTAAGLTGRPQVQGSVAKGTWLRGGADIDLFLLLDPSTPAERLESAAVAVGRTILPDARKKYAQHPYLSGTFQGHAVDLVPAYAVASAAAKMSAVDRTPFHTAWVRQRLDAAARGQTRLAKRWLKGVGAYGAQTALGGFSGYLVEVLIARFGSFQGLVTWLAAGAQPRRIAVPDPEGRPGPDQVKDDVAPLVVVDPVDPARNCAAAVAPATLALAQAAAQAYLAQPQRRFFFPAPPRPEPAESLHRALAGKLWTGIVLRPRTDRMDIVFPQFQRAARTLVGALGNDGLRIHRSDIALSPDETEVFLQLLSDGPLPDRRTHTGPPPHVPNAQQFRAKWTNHPDALGAVHEAGGKLAVDVAVRLRTPAQWLVARLAGQAFGKHVEAAAQDARILDDVVQAPAAWAPHVADFVLARHAWER